MFFVLSSKFYNLFFILIFIAIIESQAEKKLFFLHLFIKKVFTLLDIDDRIDITLKQKEFKMTVITNGLARKVNKRMELKAQIDELTKQMKTVDADIKSEAHNMGLSLEGSISMETSKGTILVSMVESVTYDVTDEMQKADNFHQLFTAKWAADKKAVNSFLKTNSDSELAKFIENQKTTKVTARVTQKLK